MIIFAIFGFSASVALAGGVDGKHGEKELAIAFSSNSYGFVGVGYYLKKQNFIFDSNSFYTPLNPPSRGELVMQSEQIPPLRGGGKSFVAWTSASIQSQFSSYQLQQESANPPHTHSAFLKSLVIPGWGQYSLGAKASGRNFVISEILLIGTSIGFKVYSNWLEDDFSAFAAQHAGIANIDNKSNQFWVDIGNFDSVFDFNDEKLRQRNTRDLRATEGDDFWQWDNEANRAAFEDLRIKKDRAAERSSF
ncbi:MAG: hypothetical protein ACE5I1_22500, partial [bacterium]